MPWRMMSGMLAFAVALLIIAMPVYFFNQVISAALVGTALFIGGIIMLALYIYMTFAD